MNQDSDDPATDRIIAAIRASRAASERTNYAVRSIARLLLITVTTALVGGVLLWFGLSLAQSTEGAVLGLVFAIVGALIMLVGVIAGPIAGWRELQQSEPKSLNADYRAWLREEGLTDSSENFDRFIELDRESEEN